MFVARSVDWRVRNLDDEAHRVFVVWKSGGKPLGVAGGDDGLAELFVDDVKDYEKSLTTKRPLPTAFSMVGIKRAARGRVTIEELVATITPDESPKADPLAEIGKPKFGPEQTNHHGVVRKTRQARKSDRWEGGGW